MKLRILVPVLVIFGLIFNSSGVRAGKFLASPDAPGATLDTFGYTLTSSNDASSTWIEASGGTALSFPIPYYNTVATTPVPLGFTFPFYERSYTQVYVSTNGMLAFAANQLEAVTITSKIPRSQTPNNFLAPFWDVVQVIAPGKVTYLTGGGPGNRYVVIQFTQVRLAYDPTTSLTFQVILRETGNFEFLYQSLTNPGANYIVGIEDSDGLDGILYLYQQGGLSNNQALRFDRPDPSWRVKALSIEDSILLTRNQGSLPVTFRNSGDLGADIIQFPSVSLPAGWNYTLLNGATLARLTDTDGNGVLDSGSVAQGADFTVVINMKNSSGSSPGNYVRFAFSAESKNKPDKKAATQVQFAVPPSFAYAYSDNDNTEAMALGVISAYSRTESTFDLTYSGASIGMGQVADENLLIFWEGENKYFSYTILDRFGNPSSLVYTINDNNPNTEEITPIFATTPNGRTGLVYLYRNESGITNVYFKILEASGAPMSGFTTPKNLTASISGDEHSYSYPTIVATPNNRFIISWTGDYLEGSYLGANMWVAVYDASAGTQLKAPTRVTTAVDEVLEFEAGVLAAMTNNQAMLAYTAFSTVGDTTTRYIEWVGLDSGGNVVAGTRKALSGSESTVSDEIYPKDAIELSPGGNVLLAWLDEATDIVRAVAINPSLTSQSDILDLETPNLRTAKDLSITKTPEGHGVVHWMDESNGEYLFYALIDEGGNELTPPMTLLKMQKIGKIFYASSTAQGLAPLDNFFSLNLPAVMESYNPGLMSADEEELWQP
jgi:hypothetical protein